MYIFCTGSFIFFAQTGLAISYAIGNVEHIALYQTVYQRIALITIPLAILAYILGWNTLKSFKPKQYTKWPHYWHGFVWHFFKPRTKCGFALVRDMKDLVRGTIYCKIEKVPEAYNLFKSTPGVRILSIKEKMK